MGKRKILVSTNNKNKIKEIKNILSELPVEVYSKNDVNLEEFDVIEDGETLAENSMIKVKEIRKYKEFDDYIIIADDSGLFVDGLDGDPGIYSARYAGEDGNDRLNNEKLLREMRDIEDKSASFKACIAAMDEDNNEYFAHGECKGYILREEQGDNGFGYDPLFVPLGYNKTFAELDGAEKNKISHRRKALEELKLILINKLKED